METQTASHGTAGDKRDGNHKARKRVPLSLNILGISIIVLAFLVIAKIVVSRVKTLPVLEPKGVLLPPPNIPPKPSPCSS